MRSPPRSTTAADTSNRLLHITLRPSSRTSPTSTSRRRGAMASWPRSTSPTPSTICSAIRSRLRARAGTSPRSCVFSTRRRSSRTGSKPPATGLNRSSAPPPDPTSPPTARTGCGPTRRPCPTLPVDRCRPRSTTPTRPPGRRPGCSHPSHTVKRALTALLAAAALRLRAASGAPELPALPGTRATERAPYTSPRSCRTWDHPVRTPVRGDVNVGNVTKIELQDWHALVTMRINGDAPAGPTAPRVSARPAWLGSMHVELARRKTKRHRVNCTTGR